MHMKVAAMRTTLNLDDTLLEQAGKLTGLEERTALIHEGLRALIARESARRLARPGGSTPTLRGIPRRPVAKQSIDAGPAPAAAAA
jgi:Arc/MetJ family transcription regulator